MDAIAAWFGESLGQYIPAELVTFIVSLFPILECRGGIVVGRLLHLPLSVTLIISVIGNVLPIPFILLFIRHIFQWLKPTKHFGRIVCKLEDRAMKKSDSFKHGEFIGLLLFVGIPLPGTGAWTGALAAAFLDMRLRKAIPSIFLGVLIAGVLISALTFGITSLL